MLLTKQTSGTILALALTAYFSIFNTLNNEISPATQSSSEEIYEFKSQSEMNLQKPFVIQSEDELKGPFVVEAEQNLIRPIMENSEQGLRGPFVVDATQSLQIELPVYLFA